MTTKKHWGLCDICGQKAGSSVYLGFARRLELCSDHAREHAIDRHAALRMNSESCLDTDRTLPTT